MTFQTTFAIENTRVYITLQRKKRKSSSSSRRGSSRARLHRLELIKGSTEPRRPPRIHCVVAQMLSKNSPPAVVAFSIRCFRLIYIYIIRARQIHVAINFVGGVCRPLLLLYHFVIQFYWISCTVTVHFLFFSFHRYMELNVWLVIFY